MELARKENTWHYNKDLKNFANINRKSMTKSEAFIWKYLLSKRQMLGYQFRRQRPVLNFIADFMCKELMLIIECDGITHQWEKNAVKDIVRQKYLEEIGYTILRFEDDEILNDIENVRRTISFYIEDFHKLHPL